MSLINGPKYPRAKVVRTNLDLRWRRKIRVAVEQDGSVDTAKAERVVQECVDIAVNVGLQLLGSDHTALVLYEAAKILATPGQRGRPYGSSKTHTPAQLAALRLAVQLGEDGSESGRRRAIAEVLAKEPFKHRDALRQYFRSHLPPLRKNLLEKIED